MTLWGFGCLWRAEKDEWLENLPRSDNIGPSDARACRGRQTASPKGKKNHKSDRVDISIAILNGEQIEKTQENLLTDWLYFQKIAKKRLKLCLDLTKHRSLQLKLRDLNMDSNISC